MAGALLPAHAEHGDLRFLVLDNDEQLDDPWAHDERGLVPTDGIKRKPHWQRDRGIHCPPHAKHLEVL
jgi:hypothetical protein